jgi:hypothetical protein
MKYNEESVSIFESQLGEEMLNGIELAAGVKINQCQWLTS